MPNEVRFNSASWQCDLGDGRSVEMELNEVGEPWLNVSRDIAKASIWMASVGRDDFKLRVGIERTKNGLRIVLDRGGETGGGWWEGDAAPCLSVEIDEDGLASVSATLLPAVQGMDSSSSPASHSVVLGRCRIDG